MIKVSVMYPYAAGARFDHAYYRDKHMPMVKQRLGAACLYYTVDKGIAGGAPGTDPVYVAKCDFVCTSIEAFQAARDPHAQEIMADIANYTDIQPASNQRGGRRAFRSLTKVRILPRTASADGVPRHRSDAYAAILPLYRSLGLSRSPVGPHGPRVQAGS